MTTSSYTPHQPLPGFAGRWLKLSAMLLLRQPVAWGALALAGWAAVVATGPRLLPSILVTWFLIHTGTALARHADGNRQLPAFTAARFLRAVALAELLPLVLIGVLILPKNFLMPVHPATAVMLSSFVVMSVLLYVVLRCVPIIRGSYGSFAMLHHAMAPLSLRDFVRQATALDDLPVAVQLFLIPAPVFVIATLCYAVGLLAPAGAILLFSLFPLWGALIYVAYREIFWQVGSNEPVKARVAQAIHEPAGVRS